MVTEGGHKAAEVARSLGVDPGRLYLWKKQFSDSGEKSFVGKGHLGEMATLRRKFRDVEMESEILKKSGLHIFKTNRERYMFIEDNRSEFPLNKICRVLEVSRSGYYAFKKRSQSQLP